jgi:hypothetical protein
MITLSRIVSEFHKKPEFSFDYVYWYNKKELYIYREREGDILLANLVDNKIMTKPIYKKFSL